jgi:S-formylglutathione hydrolase
MKRTFRTTAAVLLPLLAIAAAHAESRLVTGQFETNLIPAPLKFTALLPDGYDSLDDPVPLLYFLHGGGGDNGFLKANKPLFDELWNAGRIPKLLAVTPDCDRSFYMDYKDGSHRYETLLTGPFLDYLRKTYKLRPGRQGTYLFGISMGGMGALRMGLKYPDRFAGLAALEPGVDPVLRWKDILPRHRFWRSQDLMETMFGKPFDAAYWEANNPATIVNDNPDRIRQSGIAIFLDVGNKDAFGLDEATEFMHQILWKNKIEHEYHMVHGADHVGRTLRPRSAEALQFLNRVMIPPPPDPVAADLQKRLAPLKKKN